MMDYETAPVRPSSASSPTYRFLSAFPIAGFTLTALTDLAYIQTSNLLWLHFSEWLLFAGLVFGALAAIALAGLIITRRARWSGLQVLGGVIVLLLAALNSFIHTADGWTAVVPYGLGVSILTIVVMFVTGWLGARRRNP